MTISKNWDKAAGKWYRRSYNNEIISEHKRATYLNLLRRWVDIAQGGTILKTDLFAEAFDPVSFLFDIARENSQITGIDVSCDVIAAAKKRAEHQGVDTGKYLCCDITSLPIRDSSFDLIISDSSLDHFPDEADIITAIKELGRVLRAGGTLFISLDNKSNLTYPPYFVIRAWMKLGLAPYLIGKTLSLTRLRRVLEETGFDVKESAAIFHYPHPDALVRYLEHFLSRVSRGKLDGVIRKVLTLLDSLEKLRTRYLTGRYIAVRAVKR